MKCQYCGSEIPDNSSFCPNCGQKAVSPENGPAENGSAKNFCVNCGAPLEPGRAFCPNCGKPASGDTQQNPSSGQGTQPYTQPCNSSVADAGQQPVKKKKTGLIIAIVVICLVILAGIGAAAGFLIFSEKEDNKAGDVTVSQEDTDESRTDENITGGDITDEDSTGADSAGEDDTYTDDSDSGELITGKFESLEDFVNSDIMQQQLETQFASLEGTGMSIELTADDNKLIYNLTIEDPDLSAAMDASALESYLDSQAATFEAIAATLPASVDVENPVVVVRYLDYTGEEIASREFAAN